MIRNKLTFRQVFFTMCILLIANMAVLLFVFATPKAAQTDNNAHVDRDGVSCNSRNCAYQLDAQELAKDYQLELQPNGDITVWDVKRYVGTIPFQGHEKCTLQQIVMADND